MRFLLIIITLFAAAVFGTYASIQYTYSKRIVSFDGVPDPVPDVALVLGASIKSRKPNSVLQERLDIAAQLYEAGKIKKLLLSGDNRTVDHNEPQAMKEYLMEKGIPEQDMVLDHAGRRTYDSCYRAKEIFQIESALIVTQGFHLPRALYLCNRLGIEALGVAADTQYPMRWLQSYIREIPATIRGWIDITLLKPTPVLGNPEKVF
ncbi:YdcF family protein [Candidatus Uhrbacteria bacterium]|nr:YdcF family protein [Candidatus Uhrbacteria bacterium]